jgi:hypothetical protein
MDTSRVRNHIFVRPARSEEAVQFLDWSKRNTASEFDPEVARYPSTVTFCAYDGDGPLAYMPIQQPLFMESLAPRPGADKSRIAAALKELTQAAVTQAHVQGKGEIYFLGTDESTDAMAANHVFEKLPYSVYRLKLKDLEQ